MNVGGYLATLLFISCNVAAESCQNRLEILLQESIGNAHDLSTDVHAECNSDVGSFRNQFTEDFNRLINNFYSLSLQYMSMSGNFGKDIVERPGFKRLFRQLSDERYETAKSFIKYTAKRGATPHTNIRIKIPEVGLPVEPLPSLGRALNDAKRIYGEMASLHGKATCVSDQFSVSGSCSHDPDVLRYLQMHVDDEIKVINKLATYSNRLAAISTHQEQSLALHLFDSYLAS